MKHLVLVLMLICGTIGCQQEHPPSPSGIIVTDIRGRKVRIPSAPQRIVSLAPSNTEIVFALGKGDKLVGVTNQCDYPSRARLLPKVGDFNRPNMELILAGNPDIILAGNAIPDKALHILESAGFPVIISEALTLDGIFTTIGLIGKSIGAAAPAGALVSDMQNKITAIHAKVANSRRVSCYYMISYGKEGNWTVGAHNFIDELITLAGGINIAHTMRGPWVNMDLELLLSHNPEVIIMDRSQGGLSVLQNLPFYNRLDAVRQGRVYSIDADLLSRPGPRITEGLALLAGILHPMETGE